MWNFNLSFPDFICYEVLFIVRRTCLYEISYLLDDCWVLMV